MKYILAYNPNIVALGLAMHRVGSAGNTSGSNRPRKEKRLTYVLNASDDTKVITNTDFVFCLGNIYIFRSFNSPFVCLFCAISLIMVMDIVFVFTFILYTMCNMKCLF